MTRGGARKGAGRPVGSTKPDSKVQIALRIDKDLWKQVKDKSLKSRSTNIKIVETALQEYFTPAQKHCRDCKYSSPYQGTEFITCWYLEQEYPEDPTADATWECEHHTI